MNGRGMSPRDRYYAGLRQAEEQRAAEAKRAEEENRRRAQAEARRRQAEALEKKRRHEEMLRRKRRRATRVRVLLFLACFVLIAAFVALCVFVSFHFRTPKLPDTSDYKFIYGEAENDKENVSESVGEKKLTRGGVRYVNFTSLSEYLKMTVMGGSGTYRFIITGANEEAVFTDGSADAVVNGETYRMKGSAVCEGGDVWIPMQFVTDCMRGIEIDEDEAKKTIRFTSSGDIAFSVKSSEALPPIPEPGESLPSSGVTDAPPTSTAPEDDEIPVPEFRADLSAYEKYMAPADRDAYLILVNAWNKIGEDDDPTDLIDVVNTRKDGRNTQKMRECAEKALEAMFLELYARGYDGDGPSGYPVSVMSAFRSYSSQTQLFNQYVEREMRDDPSLSREEAEKITATYSARPGTSEHQTGLCADLHNLSSAQKSFAEQDAYKWLRDNAWKFGFILRFPEDKEDITGITFEPWHYRFVGRYHAYKIWKSGMCLEEYVESLES